MIRRVFPLVALMLCPPAPAPACSRAGGPPSLTDSYASAREVFVAHVNSVREREAPHSWGAGEDAPTVLEASYESKEVFKGQPPKRGELYDLADGIGNCTIGLRAGRDYLVMVQPNEEGLRIRFVGMISGSFPLQGGDAELATIRKLAEQEHKPGSTR